MTAGAQVVSATTLAGQPSVTAMLGLVPNDDVHEVVRVRLANGDPSSWSGPTSRWCSSPTSSTSR
ncbi:DNA-binding GntR family transcriptional regulator [Streptomyces sp. B4I13]|uniref:UTRA domain-containing protein n=1 Tax=Streptomyces TaxID=1883 RepID=UPI0015F112A2|nr:MULTISPECIES: UTRA domain-containing protein [Streptomyces]MDQ0956381.1 DNA-binding GntR family transcriptional regulator [Streptomyces sp. B4I13]